MDLPRNDDHHDDLDDLGALDSSSANTREVFSLARCTVDYTTLQR